MVKTIFSDNKGLSAPRRVPYPRGFNQQLPPFSIPITNSDHSGHQNNANTLETKPTLAYAIIGPRVRGKFDAKKAKLLAVPNGRERRDLTMGKEIRFKVKEGDEMVERVVKPEDVIGESENPSVSAFKTNTYSTSITQYSR